MSDEAMIRRAITLAMQGRGSVEPNPMVGCVIVKEGREIGHGWHRGYGQPHAEPNALASCTESPEGSTAYVTLEPCCHTNKQTPPCVPRLIAAKVKRVVVGCLDPNPDVSGRGVSQLRQAGIEVVTGVHESACRQLIAPFYAGQVLGRPYVTLKWAQTRDGKVAGPGGRRLQITGPKANEVVHDLRSRCDAILVGVNTVLMDDPMLTVRGRAPVRPLLRVVMDRTMRTPLLSRLVQSAREHPVLICCSPEADAARIAEVRSRGAEVEPMQTPHDLFRLLGTRKVTHLLVEPGPTLAAKFLCENLADRLWVFLSPQVMDDTTAPAAATLPGDYLLVGERAVGEDRLLEYLNIRSHAFFAGEASADLVRIA